MIASPHLVNDQKRVESLRKLQLLDTPIEDRFERITRVACRSLDMPIVAFTLVDETRQTFKSVQGLAGNDVPRSLSMCGHVIAGEGIMVVPDTHLDLRFADNPFLNTDPGICFYAGCPVRAPDGEKIGTLCALDMRPRELSDEQVECLQDMASLVETELRASMLSKVQMELLEELDAAQRSALIDPLTHLWNRNGMAELLKREWDHAIKDKAALTIVMADIDHFKHVNDTYGHQIGDEILKQVGQRLLAKLRSEDIVGRMGGEEFLMVLPKCRIKNVLPTVDRIRTFFEDIPLSTSVGDVAITLSLGTVSARPNPSLSMEEFIKLADQALYAAKRAGRNRVEVAELL